MSSPPPPPEVLLRASGLAFTHPAGPDGRTFELRVPHLEVRVGEVLALCGPSGSGKSTLLLILAGLLRPQEGQLLLIEGDEPIDLYGCSTETWRRLRRHFGFVYQDPREYLNDRRSIADIVADPLNIHRLPADPPMRVPSFGERLADLIAGCLFLPRPGLRRGRRAQALVALQLVGITSAQAERSPEALSGGQRQRVALARALVARPRLVFLDEPTSALDVSVQASIVDLLLRLRRENERTAYLLVTHDLPLARQIADRVAVVEGGRIVELGEVDRVFHRPNAPITRELLGLAQAHLRAFGEDDPSTTKDEGTAQERG